MNQPKENSTNANPSSNQNGNAALKLTVAEAPILTEIKVPEFGDDDDGDGPPTAEVHVDVADNGFMVTFVDEFGGCDKHVILNKEDLLKMIGQRL